MRRHYTLDLGPRDPRLPGDPGWRWCLKCEQMFRFHLPGGSVTGPLDIRGTCSAGGRHDPSLSGMYTMFSASAPMPATYASTRINPVETGWRWCQKCGCLFNLDRILTLDRIYDETVSVTGICAAGGVHDGSQSAEYWLLEGYTGEVVAKSEAAQRSSDPTVEWQNWGETMKRGGLLQIVRPRSLDQVVSLVQHAVGANARVRAVGSSWSFAGTVEPDEGHYVLETKNLNAEITSVTSRLPADSPYRGRLYHVEAGIKIHHLYMRLAERGLALPTQGGSGGQSVAGVMATGTHGGDIDMRPIADAVRAIHLVGPDGRDYWVERESTPITTAETIQAALPFINPANIKYDDDWFDALLVSFGAMGVIYSVVLEGRPAFQLEETTKIMEWEDVKAGIIDGSIFHRKQPDGADFLGQDGEIERVRYLEIVMPPNQDSQGRRPCSVTTRQEVQPAQNIVTPPDPPQSGVLGLMCDWPLRSTLLAIQATIPLALATAAGATIGVTGTAAAVASLIPGASEVIATAGATSLAAASTLAALVSTELWAVTAGCGTLMGCVAAMADVLNRNGLLWLLRDQNGALLASGRSPGVRQNVSYWIMDGFDYEHEGCMVVDSLEAFFPADDGQALAGNLQMLMDAIDDNGTVLGYLAMRFTGPSTGLMAMQQGPEVPGGAQMTCSAELTIVKGLPTNDAVMRAAQVSTLDGGGRLHWGQRNEVMLLPHNVMRLPLMYPRFFRWLDVRKELEHFDAGSDARLRTFDNEYITNLLSTWYMQ